MNEPPSRMLDTIEGNIHIAKVFPILDQPGSQYGDPLDDWWPCHLQSAVRRDIAVDDTSRSDQMVVMGEPLPIIKRGWILEVHWREEDDRAGDALAHVNVTDPGVFGATFAGRHHQEVNGMIVDVTNMGF